MRFVAAACLCFPAASENRSQCTLSDRGLSRYRQLSTCSRVFFDKPLDVGREFYRPADRRVDRLERVNRGRLFVVASCGFFRHDAIPFKPGRPTGNQGEWSSPATGQPHASDQPATLWFLILPPSPALQTATRERARQLFSAAHRRCGGDSLPPCSGRRAP